MKINDKVRLPDGRKAVIVNKDFYKHAKRFGVMIDGQFNIEYYFDVELEPMK